MFTYLLTYLLNHNLTSLTLSLTIERDHHMDDWPLRLRARFCPRSQTSPESNKSVQRSFGWDCKLRPRSVYYTYAKRSHTHVKDSVVHVRVQKVTYRNTKITKHALNVWQQWSNRRLLVINGREREAVWHVKAFFCKCSRITSWAREREAVWHVEAFLCKCSWITSWAREREAVWHMKAFLCKCSRITSWAE